jgi:hypothetical protein
MKQRKTTTLIVLAVEIATIVALHAIRINRGGKAVNNKDLTRNLNSVNAQQDSKTKSYYSFARFQ